PGNPAEARSWRGRGTRLLRSRFMVVASSPVIWLCAVPIALADLVGTFYQSVCFPIYGIPKVPRRDYLAFDRHHLPYLNLADKLSCEYCAYVNGILAYFTEIAARTEQYWCPIKHEGCVKCAHSRYKKFVDYGDAAQFRAQRGTIQHAFGDVESAKPAARD
ncbi:MAG: hypothetical protein JWQ62_2772, partial [Lacunisphaera sp.]|nr:hypothetical protein [Lacunisphaera sp.]